MLGNRRVLECSQDKGRQGQTPSGSPPGVSALATARFPQNVQKWRDMQKKIHLNVNVMFFGKDQM